MKDGCERRVVESNDHVKKGVRWLSAFDTPTAHEAQVDRYFF